MGKAENPVCGDVIEFQLRVREETIADCCFQAYGCPGAVAAAAALTELVNGQDQEFCRELNAASVLEFLGGLPSQKEHGVDLALTAFRNALEG
jgi:NifU-like protein involved in Fe-S cluster formation